MSKIKYDYIFYVLGVCLVVLLLTLILVKENINNKLFGDSLIINRTEFIDRNNYNIQINYPKLKNSKINKQVEKLINEEKKFFLRKVRKNKNYENELNINYSYVILDNLYSIHIRSYSYTGKNNDYRRIDKIIYYDSSNNKEVKIDNIVSSNKFYEVLRNKTYDYLNDNVEKYNIKDISSLSNKLTAVKNNYKIVTFGKDGIELSLEPNIVSDYKNEINISILYQDVIKYLNVNYIKVDTKSDNNIDNLVSKNYDRIRDSKNFEGKKLVAITFDDGPGYSKTEKLITELDKRDARVSFFMLGELANKQKDLVKKVYDYGHTIGSHTYDHKNLKKLRDEQLFFEVNYTNEILSGIIGEDIRFIRPPYGAYNTDILSKINMAFILWNVDTLDWKYRNAEKVRDYIVEHAEDGDIILLHDIHATTIDGAIMAIDILKNEGFEFVSLDEMLVFRNVNLQTNTAYRFFK
jgi:peptidoglycan/xylan/chitin deacetylase (PgdA/CDA1 family)